MPQPPAKNPTDVGSDTESAEPPRRSAIAQELIDFKRSIDETLNKRERLPQPMFWAVFSSRLEEVKKAKAVKRVLSDAFGEVE